MPRVEQEVTNYIVINEDELSNLKRQFAWALRSAMRTTIKGLSATVLEDCTNKIIEEVSNSLSIILLEVNVRVEYSDDY